MTTGEGKPQADSPSRTEEIYDTLLRLETVHTAGTNDIETLLALSGLSPETDFRNADFSGQDLRGLDLRKFKLPEAVFSGARVAGTNFGNEVTREQLADADGADEAILSSPPPHPSADDQARTSPASDSDQEIVDRAIAEELGKAPADLTDEDRREVESLILRRTELADASPLAGLANLKILSLDQTKVGDIAPLAGLTNLRYLDLDNTKVGDITPLAGLANLESLFLSHTKVDDIAPLAGLANLETLFLSYTKVDDIAPLAQLANLETLDLDDTKVDDIAPLAGLANLETLYLSQTQVEDIAPLAGLANLTTLNLNQTKVDAHGGTVAALRRALPNLTISA